MAERRLGKPSRAGLMACPLFGRLECGAVAVRALAYARFSTEERADPGAGIDEQLDTVCAAIAERGWELAAEVTDREVSAAEHPSRRAGFGPALEALAAGAADALVVARLDRVTRSPLAWAEIAERSRLHGWTLLAVAEGLDLRTDNDEMFAVVARCGRRFITTRTKEGIKAAKARGTRLGRPVEHSQTVRSAVESARAKGATLRQIADQLTYEGQTTPRGGRWHPNTVRSILNSSRLDAEAAETRDVIADSVRVMGPDHPDTLQVRRSLARSLRDAGRHDEAIALLEQVIADSVRVMGPDHPETLQVRGDYASALGDAGRHDEAIALLEQVIIDSVRVMGSDHPETL